MYLTYNVLRSPRGMRLILISAISIAMWMHNVPGQPLVLVVALYLATLLEHPVELQVLVTANCG